MGGKKDVLCFDCGIALAAHRSLELLEQMIVQPTSRILLNDFFSWLIASRRVSKAHTALPAATAILVQVEDGREYPLTVTPELVLEKSSLEDMRRSGLFAQFLAEALPNSDAFLKQRASAEQRSVDVLLQESNDRAWGGDVMDFYKDIESRSPNMPARTRKAYLRAAIELLKSAKVSKAMELSDEKVASFLAEKPGHRASLSAWVRFLRESRGTALKIERKRPRKPKAVGTVAEEVALLISRASKTASPRELRAVMAWLLKCLYGIPLDHVIALKKDAVGRFSGETTLTVRDSVIRLQSPVDRLVLRLLDDTDLPGSTWLFPGRNPKVPLSSSAVKYHLAPPKRDSSKETVE
jgi:hypothetical protein